MSPLVTNGGATTYLALRFRLRDPTRPHSVNTRGSTSKVEHCSCKNPPTDFYTSTYTRVWSVDYPLSSGLARQP